MYIRQRSYMYLTSIPFFSIPDLEIGKNWKELEECMRRVAFERAGLTPRLAADDRVDITFRNWHIFYII